MGRGCLIWLMLYAAITAAYRHFLASLYDPPATWIVPLAAGLFTMFGLGALWGGWLALRDVFTLRRAMSGAPLIDGKRGAAIGRVEPVGQPLLTPFGLHACVCYEYDLRRPTTNSSSPGVMDAGLGGFRAEPYVVRSGSRAVTVFGVPDFSEHPECTVIGWESYVRAREHLANTQFKQMHGANVASLFSTLMEAWADDDGSVDSHWQRVAGAGDWLNAPEVTEWLVKSAEQAALDEQQQAHEGNATGESSSEVRPQHNRPPEEEIARDEEVDDDEVDDDDEHESDDEDDWDEDEPVGGGALIRSPSLPRLVEKYLPVDEQVCLFGVYSAQHDALAPSMTRHAVMLRVLRGQPETVLAKLRNKVRAQFIAGLIVLGIVAGGLTLGTTLYLASPQTKKSHAAELSQAVSQGDAEALKALLERADREDLVLVTPPLLMQTDDPKIVQLLLDHGASPNRADPLGDTPLMRAARSGQAEIVRLLIAAGADLNALDPRYGSTALHRALDAEQDETVRILREAGAHDETVDERNGTPVDPMNSEAVAACVRYIEAIHAAEPATLKALSAAGRKAEFDDVDFESWRNVRPAGDVRVSGHVNDAAATLTIIGPAPGGYSVTWVFQMVNEMGEWKVLRERWLTKGIREAAGP